MTECYNRKGEPILDILAWSKLFEDRNYQNVRKDILSNGRLISTVWLGLNHNYGDGPPLIFETMVFLKKTKNELDCQRYSTEKEAIKGHEAMVKKWSK